MASQIGDIMSTSSVIVIVDDKQEEDEGSACSVLSWVQTLCMSNNSLSSRKNKHI